MLEVIDQDMRLSSQVLSTELFVADSINSNGRLKSIFQVSFHLKNVKLKYPTNVRYNHTNMVFNQIFSNRLILKKQIIL